MITTTEIEQRAEYGKELFSQGFNCAQAVAGACADLYAVPHDLALRMAASFGGGIGQMRMTCGAACGMFLLAGLENGNTVPHQPARKKENYQLVQHLAQQFEQENGSLICAELLGLNGTPAKQKRPCPEMVAQAIRLFLSAKAEYDG